MNLTSAFYAPLRDIQKFRSLRDRHWCGLWFVQKVQICTFIGRPALFHICKFCLCRAELSPSDRAKQTARRKAIYLELHPETGHGGDRRSIKSQSLRLESDGVRFTAETAKVTGQSERLVQLNAERGEKVIDAAIDVIRGTALRP